MLIINEQDRMIIKDLTAEINFILSIQEERAGKEVNARDISREELLQRLLLRMQNLLARQEYKEQEEQEEVCNEDYNYYDSVAQNRLNGDYDYE